MALSGTGKGGSASKTNSQTTSTVIDNTTNNVDNRAVEGDGAVFGGNVSINLAPGSSSGAVDVTTTDFGAVSAGINAAVRAVDAIKEGAAANNQLTQGAIERSLQLAANNSAAQGAETTQKFLLYGAIVAGLALLARAFGKRA